MTNTTKTVMIAIILIATALSGCIGDTAKEDEMIERMAQLEVILTDPEISEDEKIAAYTLAHEAITGEKIELNSGANVTPTPDLSNDPKYRVVCSVSQYGADPMAGIGHLLIYFNGMLEVDHDNVTVSGFHEVGLDNLKLVEIFINNNSIAKFAPIIGERNKIATTEVGEWIVRIEGTFIDGSTSTIMDTQFNGMVDLSDHPDYKSDTITVTGSGPFDARYIEVRDGQMTRAEAKALCDELGIVWGDERDS